VIVVGLSHEGPELVVTACSAFVLKRFVQVEDAHDAGATDHKRFLCSQVHQRDRRRSFTADPLRLDRCAAVVVLLARHRMCGCTCYGVRPKAC